MTWREEREKETAIDDVASKDEREASGQHWNCLFQRQCWQSSERQGGAQFGIPEQIDLPFGTKITIETLLSGDDQLHLETNKQYFAIVLEFFGAKQTAYKSVKACLNVFMRQAKKCRL